MELKLFGCCRLLRETQSLNRTFYGIETLFCDKDRHSRHCLNRTFYGIETYHEAHQRRNEWSLNRTFYGIETDSTGYHVDYDMVLIVPFMELKLMSLYSFMVSTMS